MIEYGELGRLIHANNLTVQEIVKSTKEAKDSYNKVLKKLDTYSSNRSRISLEKQLTSGAQNLMISFYSLEAQKKYLQVMEEWMKVRYENMQLKEEAGMATSQEVLTAFNSWTDLSVSIASVTDGQASLRQSLLSILGVEVSEETVLGEIPELEDKVTIKMQQLYEAVLQAKQEYDAATDGFSSARLNWENAQKKQSMGMLSREEYLQEKAKYAGKQASLSAAKMGLLQALETYRWAVKGIVELD